MAWSDEAREAAAAARRGKGANKKLGDKLTKAGFFSSPRAMANAQGDQMKADMMRRQGITVGDTLAGGMKVSDAAAAARLASGPKSAPAPVHDSMANQDVGPNHQLTGDRNHNAFGRPRSEESKAAYDEYGRDLAYRSRNGGIGSGGKR